MKPVQARDGEFLWRAVVRDAGDLLCDYSENFETREEAEAALDRAQRRAKPPYDEGWIERLPRLAWERVSVTKEQDEDGMRTEGYPPWSHSWGPLLFALAVAALVVVVVL